MSAAELVLQRGRTPALLAAVALGTAATGLLLAQQPWFTAAAVLGAALVVVTLLEPGVVLGAMLAIGAIDWSFLSGGYKGLMVQAAGWT